MVPRDIFEGIAVVHQTGNGYGLAVHCHAQQIVVHASCIELDGQRDVLATVHQVKGFVFIVAGDLPRALADHADHVLVVGLPESGVVGDAEGLNGIDFTTGFHLSHLCGHGVGGVQGIEVILSVLRPVEGILGMVKSQVLKIVGGDGAAGTGHNGSDQCGCSGIQINGIERRRAAVIPHVGADAVQGALLVKGNGVDDVRLRDTGDRLPV